MAEERGGLGVYVLWGVWTGAMIMSAIHLSSVYLVSPVSGLEPERSRATEPEGANELEGGEDRGSWIVEASR